MRYNLKVQGVDTSHSVDVGGFIDPASHDVYEGGKRALALSSVPFDAEHRWVYNCTVHNKCCNYNYNDDLIFLVWKN